MKTIIRIVGLADGRTGDIDGQYLVAYNNTVEDDRGIGVVYGTTDRDFAMRFDDFAAAAAYWQQVSRTVPVRPDGKPNRPLTSFTITFEHVGD